MLHHFKNPKPAREISLVHLKNGVKTHIVNEIKTLLDRLIKTKIHFSDVMIVSPLKNKELGRIT